MKEYSPGPLHHYLFFHLSLCGCCSVVQSGRTLQPQECSMPGFPVFHHLKFMPIELMMLSNHLILCWCLLLLCSIFSKIRVFSNELALHIRWWKYWSFSFSISPSGLISLRINWFELLAVQGTLESFLQHHNSKASILRCSAFFVVQLSHPYMTTGKTIALTRWTFVVKVMSLLSGLSLFSFRCCELLVTSYLGAADDMWLRSGA